MKERGSAAARLLNGLGAAVLLVPIRFYRRWISPALPASCRYYPTCAGYAEQALRLHGPVRGSWLALRRLGRCHPWAAGGVDHVPEPSASTSPTATNPRATSPGATSPSTLTGA